MPRRPVPYESMAARAKRTRWLRIGIWIFIIIFALSAFGGIFAFNGLR